MHTEPKSREQIEAIVQNAVEEAVEFVEAELRDERIKAQHYYDGQVYIGHEDGRSKVVATKVRDVVRAVKPSLMRVFLSTSRPVEYVPRRPDQTAHAEQATAFMHHEFERLNGHKILGDAFHDALVKKQGIIKAYYKNYPHAEIYTYSDLNDDELTMLASEDGVEIIEQTTEMTAAIDEMGMSVEAPVHAVKLSRQSTRGELCVESVPPEEFFVNDTARSLSDAYIVAHRTEMRMGDVLAMGFDPQQVMDLDSFDNGVNGDEEEDFARTGYSNSSSAEDADADEMKPVTITEAYMRLSIDTDTPVLHKFVLGGTSYTLLDFEPCDELPFAKLEIDPEPHAFYGRSLAEIVMDDQDAATSVLRGILDNVAMVNNPRIGITPGVNVDDLLNNEIGAVVRMQQMGQVQELTIPFVAGQTLSALTYLDGLVEQKTGVTQNMALNPDAMQSTAAAGISATVEAAAAQVEMYTRNLADGVKDLFGIMLRLMIKNCDEEQMMRVAGQFQPVDPRVWDSGMDIQVNVGLGTGREKEKQAALQQALQMQTMVYQQYGPMNGLVSLTNIRNTLADALAASGVRNADRYFAPITEEIEQQMLQMQQQAQAQQGQQDPNQAFLQAEQMKAQAKMQGDMARLQLDGQKAMAEEQRKRQEMAMQDDLARDRMAQSLMVDAAQTYGKYGTAVDVARVKAEQDKLRTLTGVAQGQQRQ